MRLVPGDPSRSTGQFTGLTRDTLPITRARAPKTDASATRLLASHIQAGGAACGAGVGWAPRSIQCDPPGRVRWLCPCTMPGMIVLPPASTIPQAAGRSPSGGKGIVTFK